MIRRKLILATLTGALLLSACTRMTPQQQENLVSSVPDFESIAKELESSRAAAQTDDNKTEESGEGIITDNNEETTLYANSDETTTSSEHGQMTDTQKETTKQNVTEQTTTKQNVTEQTTAKQTEKATTQAETTTAAPVISADNGALKTFSVQGLDGNTYTQEIFTKADVNIVIFWTTWCGYCKLEMPVLEDLKKNYAGQSVQIFSVVLNGDSDYYRSEAESLIEQMGITYPCLIFNDSMSDGYYETIAGYPNTVYLNRQGKVMHSIPGAYAGYGHDYALDIHSQYLSFCLANPDYAMSEE